jgi:type IV pilus assembly protein PilC
MLTYSYIARDTRTGNKVKAQIEADTEKAAAQSLIEKGLMPLEITPKTAAAGGLSNFRDRIPTKERVIFSRQLSTLINAGLPLVQSLNTVLGQTKNKSLQGIIGKLVSDIEGGSQFSEALARHPKVFDEVYVSLIAAGEESGTLDTALEKLALQQEKDAEIVSKVRGALTYPFIVLFVLFGVLIFMVTTVLPQVQSIYKSIPGTKLPLITSILMAFSQAIINWWWIFLFMLVGLIVGYRRWSKTAKGREVMDEIKMKAWPFGPIMMKLYMARFARTASTLTTSGVPMIKMLMTAAGAVGNVHISASINQAIENVKGGKSLSESLEGDENFLELVPDMIHIGEQSGSLDGMLSKVADYYEKEVDNQVKSLSTVLEPVMMIIVGVLALIVVAAILLPIYSLAGKNLAGH